MNFVDAHREVSVEYLRFVDFLACWCVGVTGE